MFFCSPCSYINNEDETTTVIIVSIKETARICKNKLKIKKIERKHFHVLIQEKKMFDDFLFVQTFTYDNHYSFLRFLFPAQVRLTDKRNNINK